MIFPAPNIQHLFKPGAVAVVGASANPGKIGYKLVHNMVASGYEGAIVPVNPKGGEDLGLKVFRSLEEFDGPLDLVTVTVPAGLVFDVVKAAARKEAKFLSIITSGFSEVGNTAQERQMVAFARENGMRILGPNIFGIYSAGSRLNATFGPPDILSGKVAIITQSGALGVAMIGRTAVENIGLSAIVSVGNKSDIDEADLLEYLVADDDTRVVMMYIEGVQNGEKLVRALQTATRVKPVVVIKSGRSKRGAVAAASHTGSLAGTDDVFDAIMRQCGVLRAECLDDAFNWCKFLAESPPPRGENTVIVTNGGGIGVMATDASEKFDLKLFDDQEVLKRVFGDATPSFGSTKNPVDITGQASAEDYSLALDAALDNDEIHAVMSLYCETALFDVDSLSAMISENSRKAAEKGKPVIFSIIGGEKIERTIANLRNQRIPVFGSVYPAVSCLGVAYRQYRHLREKPEEWVAPAMDFALIRSMVQSARQDKRNFLLPFESGNIMKAAGIRVPATRIAKNLEQAIESANIIGYPVVMKVVSKDIVHKSDFGGVALDLENAKEVIDAYQAIMHTCRTRAPNAKIEGFEIAEMISFNTETIVGARRDPSFGPVVMFGLGGIYVEVMKDVSFRAFPLGREEVLHMLKETRSYPLLLGVRGEKPKDIDAVVATVLKLGTLLAGVEDISDIELNPLVVYDRGEGALALDVRILLTGETKGEGHE